MTQLRIAVVGAGLAGSAAAWLLGRRHEVVLYEREATPGFTAHSVSVADAGGGHGTSSNACCCRGGATGRR